MHARKIVKPLEKPKSAENKVGVLIPWLQENHCHLCGIYITCDPDGKGKIYSRHPLQDGARILQIPADLMMTSKSAQASHIGRKMIEAGIDTKDKHLFLAAYILEEKTKTFSFWQPYLDFLPQSFKHLPTYFSPAELELLHGSSTLEVLLRRQFMLKNSYENLVNTVAEFSRYSIEDYVWAHSAVATRCVTVGSDIAMVPLMDMIAHDTDAANVVKITPENGGLDFIATRSINADKELCILPKEKSLQHYYSNHGIVPGNFTHIECYVAFFLTPNMHHYHTKLALLDGRHHKQCAVSEFYDSNYRHALAYCRVLSVDGRFEQFPNHDFTKPLNADNELKAINLLNTATRKALQCFHTTIEQDSIFLSRQTTYSPLHACIELRLREKLCLRRLIEKTDSAYRYISQRYTDGASHTFDTYEHASIVATYQKIATYQPDRRI